MTRDEFIDKWKLQSGKGHGNALFDLSEQLGKDLDELLKQVNVKPSFPNSRTLEKEAEMYGMRGVWVEDYHPHPNCNRSAYTAFKAGFKRCLEVVKGNKS